MDTTEENQKYAHKKRTTHSRGQVVSTVLKDSKQNNAYSFQHLLKTLEHLLISQLKGRDHTRRVLRPRVLKTVIFSLLQRLNSAAKKTRNNLEAGQALLFQSTNPLKKWLDRLELSRRHMILFPSVINQGTRSRMNGKRRNQIGGIKPVGTPIPHRINQVIVKEFALKTLAKLNPTATKNAGVIVVRLWLQTKEVTKERKRRGNSKKSFTKMNKDRKMKDSIGSKMVKANPKIAEKSVKKSRSRKAEFGTDKGDKNNLTRTWSRDLMLAWSSPISNVLALN